MGGGGREGGGGFRNGWRVRGTVKSFWISTYYIHANKTLSPMPVHVMYRVLHTVQLPNEEGNMHII